MSKIFVTILLLNIGIFSQQALLFKIPPADMTMPLILTEENGTPKTSGVYAAETKWTQSTTANIDGLLQSFSSSTDIGIKKMISDILVKANIPEAKINGLKINFKSSGVEERSVDKDAVNFSDDFAGKYPGENMFLINKLYRTKNAVIELTDGSGAEFDPAMKDAISEGLRFGNKTETIQDNKMTIEVQQLVFAYENIPMNISRISDKSLVIPEYFATDVGLNSIGSMTITEFGPNDYFVKIVSPAAQLPIEFKISDVNPKANFRVGGREVYTIKYLEISGNKVSFSISGFAVSYP
ncbi:MAG: hypothetical protein ABI543_03165 [Ignavibacteria bacterium]